MNFQTIPAAFLSGLANEGVLMLRCNDEAAYINASRLNPNGHGVVANYVLNPDSWNVFCERYNLEFGDVVVFTKIRNNELNVMGFNVDGSSMTNPHFLGVTRLNPVQPEVPFVDSSKIVNLVFF